MRFSLELDVQVPMRDGTLLAANIWREAGAGPAPVLLARTPYGKDGKSIPGNEKLPDVQAFVEAGYVVVLQDVRGTSRSGGAFVPHRHDGEDGEDTVEWLRAQSWCDGRIGTWGGSYMGFVQWQTAVRTPPGLVAMSATMTSADLYSAPWYSPGGALSLDTTFHWATLAAINGLRRQVPSADAGVAEDAVRLLGSMAEPSLLSDMPLNDRPLLSRHLPWVSEVLDHPARDNYWERLAAAERFCDITVPVLHIGGWYDVFIDATVRAYRGMRERGGTAEAREHQRLVIGPWGHPDGADLGIFPDRRFGMQGNIRAAALTEEHLRFFDRWVRGQAEPPGSGPRVRLFVMGVDKWVDEEDWPVPDTRYTDYYLSGRGPANTSGGGGMLATAPAVAGRDVFEADPRRPVPTVGGTTLAVGGYCGPADQRVVESREDVLCYSTEPLTTPVAVVGHVAMTVFVASSGRDTDIAGKLVDVHPDGRAILLCEGILRCRYRDSLARAELLEPDRVYELTVDLGAVANVFLPGHCIRLEIAGSNFPRYDRNTNTGGPIAAETLADAVTVTNVVHHGPSAPSRLTLPVLSRRG